MAGHYNEGEINCAFDFRAYDNFFPSLAKNILVLPEKKSLSGIPRCRPSTKIQSPARTNPMPESNCPKENNYLLLVYFIKEKEIRSYRRAKRAANF